MAILPFRALRIDSLALFRLLQGLSASPPSTWPRTWRSGSINHSSQWNIYNLSFSHSAECSSEGRTVIWAQTWGFKAKVWWYGRVSFQIGGGWAKVGKESEIWEHSIDIPDGVLFILSIPRSWLNVIYFKGFSASQTEFKYLTLPQKMYFVLWTQSSSFHVLSVQVGEKNLRISTRSPSHHRTKMPYCFHGCFILLIGWKLAAFADVHNLYSVTIWTCAYYNLTLYVSTYCFDCSKIMRKSINMRGSEFPHPSPS